MRHNFLFSILYIVLTTVTLTMPVAAHNAIAPGASLVLGANPTLLAKAPQLRYTVKTVGTSETFQFVHIFFLSNNGSAPVTVTEVRSSCGCTSALLGQGMHMPLIIAPGQQVSVQVSLDPFHLTPGPIDKYVWFFVAGSDKPAATLDLTGNILPAAAFTPAVMDFGNVPAGQIPSLPLTVAVDPALVPAGDTSRLVSSDPDVQVTPAAVPDGQPPDKAQRYQVTLSPHTRLGPISGQIALDFLTRDGSGSQILPGGFVSLRGTVVGAVAASPSVIAFGTVAAGQAATQEALLSGKDVSGVTVTTDSRFLTAHLVPDAPGAAHPFGAAAEASAPGSHSANQNTMATLQISLSPQAPPGPLTSQILVKTPGGQTLALPVFAYVAAKGTTSR